MRSGISRRWVRPRAARKLRTFHADTSGDLGIYGLKLPTASDGVGVNVGYEYRKEHVRYEPDAAILGGLIVGTGGRQPQHRQLDHGERNLR